MSSPLEIFGRAAKVLGARLRCFYIKPAGPMQATAACPACAPALRFRHKKNRQVIIDLPVSASIT
ncbi:hypothetical protein CYR23_03530 [Chimaeribacter arupi]|nr:hypothetical protein CYR23_03530 [Chimaeribacter arupi]